MLWRRLAPFKRLQAVSALGARQKCQTLPLQRWIASLPAAPLPVVPSPTGPPDSLNQLLNPPTTTIQPSEIPSLQDIDMSHHQNNTRALFQDALEALRFIQSSDRPEFKDVVLICVDCEAYEFDQNFVTEVGVAVLDTTDINQQHPIGEQSGVQLHDISSNVPSFNDLLGKVKHAHFRPIEYRELCNRRFVKGCEEGFLFGNTIWISRGDARKVLTNIFFDPSRLHEAADFTKSAFVNQKRNVFIVGHGINNDSKYMKTLGFDIYTEANIVRTLDTQVLAGSTKKAQVSLKRLSASMGNPGQNWHNGGNDAAFTMQALLKMVALERENPGSVPGVVHESVGNVTPPVSLSDVRAQHVLGGTSKSVPACDIVDRRAHRKESMRLQRQSQALKAAKKTS